MNFSKRRTVCELLNKFDILLNKDNQTYISITEWENGEGWDVSIGDDKIFSLSMGELEAINYLVKTLDFYGDDENKYKNDKEEEK